MYNMAWLLYIQYLKIITIDMNSFHFSQHYTRRQFAVVLKTTHDSA